MFRIKLTYLFQFSIILLNNKISDQTL